MNTKQVAIKRDRKAYHRDFLWGGRGGIFIFSGDVNRSKRQIENYFAERGGLKKHPRFSVNSHNLVLD